MNTSPRQPAPESEAFFGHRVIHATFLMALFGWGVGFYGPPIFLHAVVERTGWPLTWVSTAVTVHFLFGAFVVAGLPQLHRRFGVGPTAVVGAACVALGVLGWSVAAAPWQLFASAMATGGGWVTMGALAVNAAISPWFARTRPMALAKAYNGASIGGVIFSPLWVMLIAGLGFTTAAGFVGLTLVTVITLLSSRVFAKSPEQVGQHPDGVAADTTPAGPDAFQIRSLPGRALWRDRRFLTLALGMAAGLFAQIGLLTHLFTLLVSALGAQAAGWAMGFATACAMAGRLVVARQLAPGADRRLAAALAYAVQLLGTAVLMLAEGPQTTWLLLLGVALFGSGIGNATSLPPLIAQTEFSKEDVLRVVALIVATAQATYSFAPAVFGFVLSAWPGGLLRIGSGTTALFLVAGAVQTFAILCFLAGRRAA